MEKEQDVRIMPDFSQTFKKLPTPPSSNLLYIEASIASVQEFEDLLQCWDRKLLLKVVSGFVCDDPEAAEDIVQYAFFRVYRSLNNSRPYVVPRDILEHLKTIDSASEDLDLSQREVKVTNPSAWMYTILRNTARNYHRSKKRSEKKLNELMREMERRGSVFEYPEETAVRNASNEELHQFVRALSQPYSQIIAEYHFEGMKLKDIADKLGYSYSTVRAYAQRALQMLKEMILKEREVKEGRMERYRRKRTASGPPLTDLLARE